ncbi:YfhO family protein [Mucilaginibacter achroorhodeus]|uniref:YfhO family protein n=1 Tax=Mucilaginibacter achroorhodeus TaxID=2599294 RepID=A0A563UAI8_9SPHI|nr:MULTISPECIES: YfhO family protein [Mucilaginibacter]QXV66597.1 YfhO family protein [Mucilaginibacter sp. 21P]TWR28293.1 YfhO family protein [Mucilaginibacter achroorhodeus]
MNNWIKRNGGHLIVAAIFFVLTYAYFLNPIMQGKILYQGDVLQAKAMQKEIMDVKEKTGHAPLWTNQMFGGMPSYQIWAKYGKNLTTYVIDGLKGIFPNPVDTVLLYLFGAYMLFNTLGLKRWLAAAGAVAFAFSSYNFIYIEAGHANQAYAIAFFAPLVAGIIMTLRGQYILGASLTAFFLAMEIRSNHVQMTYYLVLALIILVFIELYHAIKAKTTAQFFKAIAYLSVGTIIAVLVNAGSLWTTYEYSKLTIRGKPNLKSETTAQSTGLTKDYAYLWSESPTEIFTFFIPNAYGGSSSTTMGEDSKVAKALIDKGVDPGQAQQFASQLPLYWGNKPSTVGPWYFGAVVFFFFVLGLIIIKNRIKWWLLGAVLLSVFLSFGKNLPFISDLFFDYFPLYNKFRAVESTLVIASLCFPILAFLALNEVFENPDKAYIFAKAKLAFYITGGITLLMIVLPGLVLSFKGTEHQNLINNLAQLFRGDMGAANSVAGALVEDRQTLERQDAIRTLIFIAIAFGLVWIVIKQKINTTFAAIVVLGVVLIDMWSVDKRYLKDDTFVSSDVINQAYVPREVDEFIMRDKDPNFRVMDLSLSDPFHDSHSSYFYKTVGGFHPARLRRFDEIVENQFSKSVNHDVLDMLNTKYIITADPKTGTANMQTNNTACGNAWFVKSVKYVSGADQEMQAISSFDPKNEAMIDQSFKKTVEAKTLGYDANSSIKLVSYEPEHLVYQSGSMANQVAIFSEIFYDKGWKMLIDGVEQPYYRANYVLRAATIPVGNHKVEFIFHPASYYTGENISLAGSVLLILALGGAVYTERKKTQPAKA